jgi:hypothetical protein
MLVLMVTSPSDTRPFRPVESSREAGRTCHTRRASLNYLGASSPGFWELLSRKQNAANWNELERIKRTLTLSRAERDIYISVERPRAQAIIRILYHKESSTFCVSLP